MVVTVVLGQECLAGVFGSSVSKDCFIKVFPQDPTRAFYRGVAHLIRVFHNRVSQECLGKSVSAKVSRQECLDKSTLGVSNKRAPPASMLDEFPERIAFYKSITQDRPKRVFCISVPDEWACF